MFVWTLSCLCFWIEKKPKQNDHWVGNSRWPEDRGPKQATGDANRMQAFYIIFPIAKTPIWAAWWFGLTCFFGAFFQVNWKSSAWWLRCQVPLQGLRAVGLHAADPGRGPDGWAADALAGAAAEGRSGEAGAATRARTLGTTGPGETWESRGGWARDWNRESIYGVGLFTYIHRLYLYLLDR